jgi:hypothetical protein
MIIIMIVGKRERLGISLWYKPFKGPEAARRDVGNHNMYRGWNRR